MEIINIIDYEQIKTIIMGKAKYQKVLFVYDDCNCELINDINNICKKDVIFISCKTDADNLKEITYSGIKVLILAVNDKSYFSILNYLEDIPYVIDIFIGGVLPIHCSSKTNYYLFTPYEAIDFDNDYLFLVCATFEYYWQSLSSGEETSARLNYIEKLEYVKRCFSFNEYIDFLCTMPKEIIMGQVLEISMLNVEDCRSFCCFKLLSTLYLFWAFKTNNVCMTDIYKMYQNNIQMINMTFKMMTNERTKFLLKNRYNDFVPIILDILDVGANNIKYTQDFVFNLKNEIINYNSISSLKYCLFYSIFDKI